MLPRRRPHSHAIPRSPPGFRDFEEAQELRKHRFYIFVIAALAVVGFIFHGSAAAHTGNAAPAGLGMGDLAGPDAGSPTLNGYSVALASLSLPIQAQQQQATQAQQAAQQQQATQAQQAAQHRPQQQQAARNRRLPNYKRHRHLRHSRPHSSRWHSSNKQHRRNRSPSNNRLRNPCRQRPQPRRRVTTLPAFASVSRVATTATTLVMATTAPTSSLRARGRVSAIPVFRATPRLLSRIRLPNSCTPRVVGVRGPRARLNSG